MTVRLPSALTSLWMLARSDRVSHKTALNCVKLGHFRPPAVNPRVRESEIGKGVTDVFAAAFPNDPQPITIENIANAISAYERTLLTPSPFDAYLAGNQEALSPAARAGLAKFINTGCVACHNGVGVGGGMYQKFGVVEDYWKATGSDPIDKGRAEVTKDPADLYVFRVASLRNVAMTPPYFHDGSVATLPEAVKVMARVQLGVTLSDADTGDIVAFLKSLTGELPANFATAPVLPSGAIVARSPQGQ